MSGESARILKAFSAYSLGSIASSAINFILVPLYTRTLTPELYGSVVLIQTITTLLGLIAQLGFPSALLRFWVESKTSGGFDRIGGSAIVAVETLCVLVVLGFNLSLSGLYQLLPELQPYTIALRLASLSIIFSSVKALSYMVLQGDERPSVYMKLNIVDLLAGVILIGFFLLVLRRGVQGVFEALLIKEMLICIPSVLVLKSRIRRIRFIFADTFRMMKYGVPVVVVIAHAWIVDGLNRFFLAGFASFADVGVYNLGARVASIMTIALVTPLANAWSPIAFSLGFTQKAQSTYSRLQTYVVFIGTFLCLVLAFVALPLVHIITNNPAYWQATKVVFVLALSQLMFAMYYGFATPIGVSKRTELSAIMWLINALVSVGLNWLLIPRFGLNGAMWATFFSYLQNLALSFFLGQHLFKVHYEYLRMIKVVSVATFAYLISFFVPLQVSNIYVAALLRLLLVTLTFIGGLTLLKFFREDELTALRNPKSSLLSLVGKA